MTRELQIYKHQPLGDQQYQELPRYRHDSWKWRCEIGVFWGMEPSSGSHTCIPVNVTLVFPGASMKVNGAPTNIQGNLTALHMGEMIRVMVLQESISSCGECWTSMICTQVWSPTWLADDVRWWRNWSGCSTQTAHARALLPHWTRYDFRKIIHTSNTVAYRCLTQIGGLLTQQWCFVFW